MGMFERMKQRRDERQYRRMLAKPMRIRENSPRLLDPAMTVGGASAPRPSLFPEGAGYAVGETGQKIYEAPKKAPAKKAPAKKPPSLISGQGVPQATTTKNINASHKAAGIVPQKKSTGPFEPYQQERQGPSLFPAGGGQAPKKRAPARKKP